MELLKLFAFLGFFLVAQARVVSAPQKGNLKAIQDPAKVHPAISALTTGTNFVFAVPNHHQDDNANWYTETIILIVTNYDTAKTATVTVKTPFGLFDPMTINIPPLQTNTFTLPPGIQTDYRDLEVNYYTIANNSIYLNSDTQVSVVVRNTQNGGGLTSDGMYVVYPACSLGTTYRTPGDQSPDGRLASNIWSIVAIQDNTKISIFPEITNPSAISLNAGEVLTLASNFLPLTNYQINSTLPVAVVTGTVCGFGPGDNPLSCDYEATMLFPGPSTGTQFPFTQFASEESGHLLVLAQNNNTMLTLNGRTISILNDHEYTILPVSGSTYLISTKPVDVFAMSSTPQGAQGAPFIVHVPAVSHFTNQTFLQMTTGLDQAEHPIHYIRLETYMTATESKSKFLIDGVPVPPSLFKKQGTSSYYMVDYQVTPGTHTVQTTDSTVKYAATVYGYSTATAYAYTPGIDVPNAGNC